MAAFQRKPGINDNRHMGRRKKLTGYTLQAQVDALKRLQADTAAQLDALLPAILQSSPSFDPTGDRAFKGEL